MKRSGRADTAPRVYSYIRFSTPEQKLGYSLRRQIERARAFAARKGLQFDEQLRDEGLSGYHGAHRKRGALGRFLARVRKGKIPPGSFLVVEKISRLGREDVLTSLKTILVDLIENGIVLQTLAPEMTYDRASLNGPEFVALWLHIQTAHRESAEKSDFTRKTFEDKRMRLHQTGEKMGGWCPNWVVPVREGRKTINYKIVDAKAEKTIRAIFDMRIAGLGKALIATRLNTGDYWFPRPRRNGQIVRWHPSYVAKILENPAVIGLFQPHAFVDGRRMPCGDPVADYYPAVVPKEDFYRVQAILKKNKNKRCGGRPNGERNLFVGMAVCAYCGAPMTYQPKCHGSDDVFYVCSAGRVGGGCGKGHSVRYDELQETILNNCTKLRPEHLLPQTTEQEKEHNSLREQVSKLEAEHSRLLDERQNLWDQLSQSKVESLRSEYEAQIAIRANRCADLEHRLSIAREALAHAENTPRLVAAWRENIERLKIAISGNSPEAVERRSSLKAHLADLIERIEIFAVGYKTVFDPTKPTARVRLPTLVRHRNHLPRENRGDFLSRARQVVQSSDDLGEYLGEVLSKIRRHHRAKSAPDFIRDALEVRQSRRGRFYRIFFRTGATIDLAPPTSIADRWEYVPVDGETGRFEFVRPALDVLARQIERNKRQQAWKRRQRRIS